MDEGLGYGFVGVLELNVFADEADSNLAGGAVQAVEERAPAAEVGFALDRLARQPHHDLVEMLGVEHQGHVVDRHAVHRLDDGVGSHVAEQRNLAAHLPGNVVLGAEHQHIGLDAELLKLLHRVLCRLGFQLLGSTEEGYIGEMHAAGIVLELPAQLSHGLEER